MRLIPTAGEINATGSDLEVTPKMREVVLGLPSGELYQLEQAGQLATEILDARVAEWAEEGWTQRRMAEEMGCSQPAIKRRCLRLGVKTEAALRGEGSGRVSRPDSLPIEDEIVDPADVEIVEDGDEEDAWRDNARRAVSSKLPRQDHAQLEQRKNARGDLRFIEAEGIFGTIKTKMRRLFEIKKNAEFDDEHEELFLDSARQIRDHVDLLILADEAEEPIDWDAELGGCLERR